MWYETWYGLSCGMRIKLKLKKTVLTMGSTSGRRSTFINRHCQHQSFCFYKYGYFPGWYCWYTNITWLYGVNYRRHSLFVYGIEGYQEEPNVSIFSQRSPAAFLTFCAFSSVLSSLRTLAWVSSFTEDIDLTISPMASFCSVDALSISSDRRLTLSASLFTVLFISSCSPVWPYTSN